MNKRNVILLLMVLFLNAGIYGQTYDKHKDFIYTISNQLIYADKVEYVDPFLASSYIMLDSIKYKLNSIKFYNNSDGFFANISLKGGFSSRFAERIEKGRINLYENWVSSPGHMAPTGFNGGMMMMGGGRSKIQYYNKEWGDLKKASYKNLIVDLADNEESMLFLKKYKIKRTTANIFYIVGGAIALTSIYNLYQGTKQYSTHPYTDKQRKRTESIIFVGLGTVMVGSIITFGSGNNIKKAIEAYNR